MKAGPNDRIATRFDRLASVLFAGAVGYAAYVGLGPIVALPELAICAAAAAIFAHLSCSLVLKSIARSEPQFRVRAFDVRDIETIEAAGELLLTETDRVVDELVLTDADRVMNADDTLMLDDVLAELGPDSRVVRLFDRTAMPTPGQLKSRIDDHLGREAAQTDASQALSDALAELRRSLR